MGDDTDPWRAYFRAAESNLYDIIENAIRVAATDHPEDFRQRRGRLVEFMFSRELYKCQGSDKCEGDLPVPNTNREGGEDEEPELDNGSEFEERGGKEVDIADGNEIDMGQHETNLSDEELNAFVGEIEQEHLTIAEVLQLKEVISDDQVQDYSIICESLRKLQSLALTAGILKETGIGKDVNPLRWHQVEEIRNLASVLIQNWKSTVDEWMHTSKVDTSVKEKRDDKKNEIADDESPVAMNPPLSHENFGSQFPPLDEAAFHAGNHGPPMELWKILDDLDEHGNIIKNNEMVVISGEGDKREFFVQKPTNVIELKQMSFSEAEMNSNFEQMDKQVNFKTPSDPDSAESATNKRAGTYVLRKSINPKSCNFSKRPKVGEKNKVEPPNENAEEMKLEAIKKKLKNSYSKAQKGNKRTVQIIDLQDLPKVNTDKKQESSGRWRKQFKYRNIYWNGAWGRY